MLFDRLLDPLEMRNVAGTPEYAQVESEMENRLKRWMQQTDDPFDTGKRLPVTGMLDLGQQLVSEHAYGMLPKEYRDAIIQYKPTALPSSDPEA